MKAKNQLKPSVLRHKVEVSFAEAEAMDRISFQGPSMSPWTQHNASSEYPCHVIRDELKPQSEMLAPSSVMTSSKLKHPSLSSHKTVGLVCVNPSSLPSFLQKATSWEHLAALITAASVVEVVKILATFDRQCTSALLHKI